MKKVIDVKTSDLVFQVTKDVDPQKLDLDKYDDFLEEVCGHRDFQKEAIRTVVRFLLGGEYKNTEDLARENFEKNPALREYYGNFESLKNKLQFPDKLACTMDLATATGKSWIMYAVAQILLCEGAVDQVLVLAASTTVKQELIKKFERFAVDKNLRAALQDEAITFKVNPRIINASKTIKPGDICIDNVHKTYTHVTSSIHEGLIGRGRRTLVLNDESHHILNPEAESSRNDKLAMKEWEKFLKDSRYDFRFIVGSTGTPYMGNEYARDVVYRYSVMQAMEGDLAGNFVIKKIDYVQKAEAKKWYQKMEEIYANHQRSKKQWNKAKKHMTIFVTQTISKAEKLANDIKYFLIDKEKITIDEADKKVLVVTSSPKHETNRDKLRRVDDKESPVEWIVSVSMLTEGWDVDNIFQIVPHEERAFNSKLLIAQVLGRGLRVPPEYASEQPTVIIYNHDKWSEAIKDLVYEVWDYEHRVRSYIVQKDRDYNFELHNLNYRKIEVVKEKHPRKKEYRIPKVPELSTQSGIIKLKTTYYQIKEAKEKQVITQIPVKMYSIDRVVNDIINKLAEFDSEAGTSYAQRVKREQIKKDIITALKKAGSDVINAVTEENKNRIERSFDVLKREAVGTTTIKRIAEEPYTINTNDMPMRSEKISAFQKSKALIYQENSVKLSKPGDIDFVEEAKRKAIFENVIQVANKYMFKCPLNIVVLSHGNEREFANLLVNPEYAKYIDAWVKSVDKGFYSVPYSYRKGSHQKEAKFNPDFFIKIGEDIFVVEVKSDEDITEINRAKLKYAKRHFSELNKKPQKPKYYFKFVSPQDFTPFFEAIKKDAHREYITNLEAELKL